MAMKKRWILFLWTAVLAGLTCPGPEFLRASGDQVELSEEIFYIALTFDDGPKQGTTDLLLDGLRERGAAGTFFLVGDQAVMYPDLVRRMQAEGHQVGNHTWSHTRLEGDPETIGSEIRQMDQLLREILGEGDYWLRPPYGIIEERAAKAVEVPLVKWSIDPRDWESRNTAQVVQTIVEQAQPNSIVLLHDIYPTSVTAALQAVDQLQQRGYWFVTVEELLRINGITPRAGQMYRTGKDT